MSTRAQLSETINRLLPGEKNKRIRESILAAATYSGSRTDQLRQSIDAANRVKTGLLVAGTTVIVTDTTADISGYVWVIDFAVKQPAALETIVILAPDATYAREDWFVGLSDGTIEYRSGTIDALGNSTPPVYDSATEVVLHRVTRNPDSTNTDIEIPAPSNLIDFIEQNIIPLVRDGKLTNSGIKAILDDLGAVIGYQFPTTVKGLPGTEDDEFVTKKQLPVISQYGLLNGGTILWTTVGFNFQWSPAQVAIGGECSAPSAEIPLTAAHATLNRVDLLGWLKTAPGVAEAHVIQGTPAPTFNPPPFDPTTFVVGIPVQIPAAATAPSGISTEVIYAENTGAPEWVPSSTGTGTSNPADTANPKSGTYAVKDSAVENGFRQIFTRATTIDITTVTTFGLDAALIASLGAGQGWTIGFLDASGNPASNTIALPLIKSQLTYQVVAVNLDLFTFTDELVKGLVLTYVKTKGPAVHAGVYFDNIKLQGGVDQPNPVSGVKTVTGDGVGGTPTDPVLTFPTPAEIGALEEAPSDTKVYGRKDAGWVDAKPVNQPPYANQATMLADQANQIAGFIYIDGTSTWAKLATSTGLIADYVKVGDVAPGGGGADTNAVHYNSADGKTASEKAQARENIGSSAGIAQIVTTSGFFQPLTKTSNFIVFTDPAPATLQIRGITPDEDGTEICLWNRSGLAMTLIHEYANINGYLNLGSTVTVPIGEFFVLRYSTAINRWVGVEGRRYLRKDIADIHEGTLTQNGFFYVYGQPTGGALAQPITQVKQASTAQDFARFTNPSNVQLAGINASGIGSFDRVYVTGRMIAIGAVLDYNAYCLSIRNWSSGAVIARYQNAAGTVVGYIRDDGTIEHPRSNGSDRSIRRDEKFLNTSENVVTAGAINNQAITAGIFSQRFTLATSLTGHANGENGRELTINNANTVTLDLEHESASSTAANRYYFATLANLTIPPRGIVILIYNSTVSRWELKSKNF